MPPVDRLQPIRAASSESSYSLMEFMREFPDDDACLDYLWRTRHSPDGNSAYCPKCERERAFKRYKTSKRRQSWTCTACGHHVHPTAGTIFGKSSTSLHLWFYAMYLITSTRCGISAKHLERELGVTYKTAWRMFNKIRNQLMSENHEPLSGEVEVDETFMGGKIRESERRKFKAEGRSNRGPYTKRREIVFGAVERQGRIRTTIISSSQRQVLTEQVREFVLPGSMIYTDDWSGYNRLERHFRHRRINHSQRVYVMGNVHTQTIEGFFGLFKTGVRGAHHSVSAKWLQGYLNEWTWRYNHRDHPRAMFELLLDRAVERV